MLSFYYTDMGRRPYISVIYLHKVPGKTFHAFEIAQDKTLSILIHLVIGNL